MKIRITLVLVCVVAVLVSAQVRKTGPSNKTAMPKTAPSKSATPKGSTPASTPASAVGMPVPLSERFGNAFVADKDKNLYLVFNNSLYRRTTPGGDDWGRVAEHIKTITIDPQKPEVIYAITDSNSLLKTLDRGDRWVTITNGLPTATKNCVTIHPTNNQAIYVCTDAGLYKTTDGGFSWQATSLVLPVRQYMIDRQTPNVSYALIRPALLGSVDGGQNWQDINTGLPKVTVRQAGRTATAVPAAVEQILIAGGAAPYLLALTAEKGVFRSNDHGRTWLDANSGLPSRGRFYSAYAGSRRALIGSDGGAYESLDGLQWARVKSKPGQVTLDSVVGVYESDSEEGMFVSDWLASTNKQRRIAFLHSDGTLIGLNYGALRHSNVTALRATIVDGQTAILAGILNTNYVDVPQGDIYGVLYLSLDEGRSWHPVFNCGCNRGYISFPIPLIVLPRQSRADVWIHQANCYTTHRSEDGGRTWAPVKGLRFTHFTGEQGPGGPLFADAIGSISFDPSDKTLVYLTADSQYRYKYEPKTGDGQTVDLKSKGTLLVSETGGKMLFTSAGMLSTDGGWTWVDKRAALEQGGVQLSGMNVPDLRLLYFREKELLAYQVTHDFMAPWRLSVFRSRDLGDSWEATFKSEGEPVYWIEYDEESHTLFMSKRVEDRSAGAKTSSWVKLAESADGGRSWRDLYRTPFGEQVGSEAIRTVAALTKAGGRLLFLGGQNGLWRSADEGKSWQPVGGIR